MLAIFALVISCENGKLIITPDVARVAIMEREMVSLKKKFEAEKLNVLKPIIQDCIIVRFVIFLIALDDS